MAPIDTPDAFRAWLKSQPPGMSYLPRSETLCPLACWLMDACKLLLVEVNSYKIKAGGVIDTPAWAAAFIGEIEEYRWSVNPADALTALTAAEQKEATL